MGGSFSIPWTLHSFAIVVICLTCTIHGRTQIGEEGRKSHSHDGIASFDAKFSIGHSQQGQVTIPCKSLATFLLTFNPVANLLRCRLRPGFPSTRIDHRGHLPGASVLKKKKHVPAGVGRYGNVSNVAIQNVDHKTFLSDSEILGRSSLKARSKHIYDLASGEILLLSKIPFDRWSLRGENRVLEAIEQRGIRVVPRRIVKLRHPKGWRTVWGLVEDKIPGIFVRLQDYDAPEKLFSEVSSNPVAARNLMGDVQALLNSFNSCRYIYDPQGVLRPDGHFIIIDPIHFGNLYLDYDPSQRVAEGLLRLREMLRRMLNGQSDSF